jgi:hypothetical protein
MAAKFRIGMVPYFGKITLFLRNVIRKKKKIQDSVVGIAKGYGLDDRGAGF